MRSELPRLLRMEIFCVGEQISEISIERLDICNNWRNRRMLLQLVLKDATASSILLLQDLKVRGRYSDTKLVCNGGSE